MNTKLDFDATKLFEALKYQIHVAIDYCHTLEKHDVLWIEVFGDVTVAGRDQVEVKNYIEDLTDGHENFWNTLSNWLKPEFAYQHYTNLILLTTQAFGERASLKNWDNMNVIERLATLEAIHKSAETRFENSNQTNNNERKLSAESPIKPQTVKPPKILKLQRKILAMENRESLLEVLSKIKIITEQPDLFGLIERYKMRYLKGILPHRMDSFLDDLFGFMTDALKIKKCWQFSVGEFDKKFAELTARYLVGTLKFPRIDSEKIENEAAHMNVRDRRFAMKLDEIGGGKDLILQATIDLIHAQHYIAEVIKDYTTSQQDIENYSRNQLRIHCSSRLSAMYKCAPELQKEQLKRASFAFYFERCSEAVTPLSTYDFTPAEFRNGIYHMLADEEAKSLISEFHWRLW
ncbi:hypothetical protein EC24_09685 [Salmonella enterica subsp. enterica serovar Bareilly str. CFSAN000181]|uniref:Uncharacterized protein n=1 Tax=Salmonella enterica subsp. enterica serovar Karamoja TaxID=2500153 RepID=A0A3Q9MJS8_SALET|nr:hypothetical protein [Salmonella enterica]AZT36352.1 hypothetical protein ELZ88_05600 [Salmonella enterica subsp. enterica serovar Karamoja]EAW1740003.1 hypothetical protein [Salmonella enterica subsp. enterica]EBS3371454.1 hypothetical protein [Salmonella enterica subsp. enterica serovar Millesi]AZT40818.1 hypothetical protein EL007_05610 [Salmonella enterica subsp. enterica serovar Karamoja]EAC0333317.1 hypothetical protein [Salmonella enterica subsp. enterica serovar Karamoja]